MKTPRRSFRSWARGLALATAGNDRRRPLQPALGVETLEPRLLLAADLSVVGAGLQAALVTQLDPAIVQQLDRSPLPLIGNQAALLGNAAAAELGTAASKIASATAGITSGSSAADLQAALFA